VRYFNITGSCDPARHYMIPAERRLPGAEVLIAKQAYFVVHAPRQTGKTTAMKALARRLTDEGRYAALRFSCQDATVFPDDILAAQKTVWSEIEGCARTALPEGLRPPARIDADPGSFLRTQIARWAEICPRPLVLIFDEIDAIGGDSLRSILSQLRTGFDNRPAAFPWSLILCGMRDVRDYKVASGGDPTRLGTSSPFNIKEKSLRIVNFTEADLRELYAEHTAETGQVFTENALERAWELCQGQPWLCNALAREVVEEIAVPLEEPITAAHFNDAKERLILARATHLDSLISKLVEPRVHRVIAPVLSGELMVSDVYNDDIAYVRDLGLVSRDNPLRIANPIYREVTARVLTSTAESNVVASPASFLLPDGRLAFLQRIVNGGSFLDREYGVGRGRIDLLVRFPHPKPGGGRAVQRRALELKVWRKGRKDPLREGLAQIDAYLASLRLGRGTLVIFDARGRLARKAPRFEEVKSPRGRAITLLRA